MATGKSVQAALNVLSDYSISYLMRNENYRTVETAISGGETLPTEQMQQLLQIFAHDLQQDTKYAASILNLLTFILDKIKLGEYAAMPELLTTATCVMNILSKTAPLHKVQSLQSLCLQVLLAYPDSLYVTLGTEHSADLQAIMDQYLSSTNVEVDIKAMMMDILLRVLQVLPTEERNKFVLEGVSVWFSRVVPLIFNGPALREKAITATELLIPHLLTIDYSDNLQWNTVFKNMSDVDKYPATLKSMLIGGDQSWHRAWCCVIQLLGTKLHKSANLINSLLVVLENAFKMNTVDRCRAFHCWNYVIENFSLNMQQFFTSRRIRLLLIPLLVNNAKEEKSALAKFNTWWLLLGKLQTQIEPYLDTIVMKFLNTCFGPPRACPNDKPLPVLFLNFPKVQAMVIQAVVEMAGHCNCSGCVIPQFDRLTQPMLNANNLISHHAYWIHAIGETSVLISKLLNEQATQNMSCLWTSLFKYLNEIEDNAKQEIVFIDVVKTLSELVKRSTQNESLADLISSVIMPIIFDKQSGLLQLVIKYTSNEETKLTNICKLLLCPSLKKCYSSCGDPSRLRVVTDLGTQHSAGFPKWLLQELTTDDVSLAWWTSLVDSIVNSQSPIPEDTAKDIFIWPITKLEYFTEVDNASESWSKMYKFMRPRLLPDSLLCVEICNILILHYNTMPVADKFAIHVLPLTIHSILKNDFNKVTSMLKELTILTELSGKIQKLSNDSGNAVTIEIIKCLSFIFQALSQENEAGVAKYAITIANNILKHVLACPENVQVEIGDSFFHLMNTIEKFFSNTLYIDLAIDLADSISKCVKSGIPMVKQVALNISNITTSKGVIPDMKIVSTAGKNQQAISHEDKNEDTLTLDSKFSTPKNKLNTSKKTKSNSKIVKKIKEGDEEFVVIKSNWKFNPNNLTEHQKEVLKKKREDIPALYQDLSQSQDEVKMKTWKMPGYKSDSQDISTSASGSLDNDALTHVLKDIPNPEICPNFRKAISKEEDLKVVDNQTFKGKLDLMKENSEINPPITPAQKPKNITKSPHISLKDKITKNVQNLLARSNGSTSAFTSADSMSNNKLIDTHSHQTPDQKNKSSAVTAFSAPPKVDSDRPSRIKRKPKKLEGDFEIPELIKRKRNSLDSETKPLNEKETTEVVLVGEQTDNIVISDEEQEPIETPAPTSTSVSSHLIGEVDDKNMLNIDSTGQRVVEEETSIVENISIKNTPKSALHSKPSHHDRKSSSKKKNRLEVQLAIDTVEGHPLLTPKRVSSTIRKSRVINENSTPGKRSGIERSATKEKTRNLLDNSFKIKPAKKDDNIEHLSTSKDEKSTNLDASIDFKSVTSNNSQVVCVDVPNSEDFIESSQESPMPSITIKSSRRSVHKHSHRNKLKPDGKSSDSGSTSDSESDAGHIRNQNNGENQYDNDLTMNLNKTSRTKNDELNKFEKFDVSKKNISEHESEKKNPKYAIPLVERVDSGVDDNSKPTIGRLCNDNITDSDTNLVIQSALKSYEINTLSHDTIAEMDTQPMPTIGNEIENSLKDEMKSTEVDTSKHNLITDALKNGNKNKLEGITLSDETIAEMDTEPFVTSVKIDVCSNDVIIIDDNSCEVLPKDNIVSDSEMMLANADTEPVHNYFEVKPEICDVSLSDSQVDTKDDLAPIHLPEVIPASQEEAVEVPLNISSNNSLCSPLKDNEERNNEFLNNTLDISPIKVLSPRARGPSPPVPEENSNDYVVISLVSPEKNKDEIIEKSNSPEIFTNDKTSPDKLNQSPPRNETSNTTGSPSSLSLKKNRSQVKQSGRGAQMLGMCQPGNFYSNTGNHLEKSVDPDDFKQTTAATPARRNLRIADADGESNNEELNNQGGNFLSFTKVLPSASSSPAVPILKRKLSDITDDTTLSPAFKRKRVSFHDPPVSTTVSVQKYIEDSSTRSPQQGHNKNKDRKNRPLVAKSLIKKLENEYPECIGKVTTEFSNTDDGDDGDDGDECVMEDTQINSMPETPQAEIVNRDVMNDSEPIYPGLINCADPVTNITEELTTESMMVLFIKDLGTITTIGELAKLAEPEINRLSIKSPKVETVRKVLENYYARHLAIAAPKPTEISNIDVEIQTEFDEEFLWNTLKDRTSKEVIETCLEKKSDFIEEFSNIINVETKQKISSDLPVNVISQILCERLHNTSCDDTEDILTGLVRRHPQQFLNKTIEELGPDCVSEKIGLDCIEAYLLKKLTPGDLVEFCCKILQKKIPSENK